MAEKITNRRLVAKLTLYRRLAFRRCFTWMCTQPPTDTLPPDWRCEMGCHIYKETWCKLKPTTPYDTERRHYAEHAWYKRNVLPNTEFKQLADRHQLFHSRCDWRIEQPDRITEGRKHRPEMSKLNPMNSITGGNMSVYWLYYSLNARKWR